MHRRTSGEGVFALYLFGSKLQIASTPSLVDTVFESPALSFNGSRWSLLTNFFGADKRHEKEYLKAHADTSILLQNQLLKTSSHSPSRLNNRLRGRIQDCVPNLVSFSESLVDQNEWERPAYPLLKSKYGHNTSVEVSLFALIRNFTGHVTLPTIVGSEFLEVYPSTLDDLWDLDGGFRYLTLGLPRFLGIPSLTRAHVARRRLLHAIHEFHDALDRTAAGHEPGQPWRDLSDVSGVMTERSAIWRNHSTSESVKGPYDLSLLWA